MFCHSTQRLSSRRGRTESCYDESFNVHTKVLHILNKSMWESAVFFAPVGQGSSTSASDSKEVERFWLSARDSSLSFQTETAPNKEAGLLSGFVVECNSQMQETGKQE